ncbi:MAG: hypothetical protein Q7R47_01855, partial [Candidatus Diapherotrites archaeon]|nr:hypothetical protein [Candidatus Diapherotrites archaeon]
GGSGGGGGGGGTSFPGCGNNFCDLGENAGVCSIDCGPVCGDLICSHFESAGSCSVDCVGSCGNGLCDFFESALSCPADCAQHEPVVLSESRSDVLAVSPTDAGGVSELLRLFDWLDSSNVELALKSVRVKRYFVVQTLQWGTVVYKQTRVVLELTNISGVALKDVNVLEVLPVSGVDAMRIKSDFPFVRVTGGKAIMFLVPGLLSGQSVSLDYVIPFALSSVQQKGFGVPLSSFVVFSTPDVVSKFQCESSSDCQTDSTCTVSRCVKRLCYSIGLPDGESCAAGSVCRANACVAVFRPQAVQGLDPLLLVSLAVILLAVGGIGFEYFRKG